MASLIDEKGLQHYSNRMVKVENRKFGTKSIIAALAETDLMIDESKKEFEKVFGNPIEGTFTNKNHSFSPGKGFEGDRENTIENGFVSFKKVFGNLKYRRKDGVLIDVWETGVDLESFGEREGSLIKIRSCGKNLFNVEESKRLSSSHVFFNSNGEISFKQDGEKLFLTCEGGYRENTQYTLSGELITGRGHIHIEYTDGSSAEWYMDIKNTTTTHPNKTVLRVYNAWTNSAESKIKKVQIEEGVTKTSYEAYVEDTKELQLTQPLNRVGSVSDKIYEMDRELYLEQNLKKNKLTGNENWGINEGASRGNLLVAYLFIPDKTKEMRSELACDRFEIMHSYPQVVNNQGIWSEGGRNSIVLSIDKGLLSSPDIHGLKKWLSENPTTILYQLDVPDVIKVSHFPITLKCWKNGNIMIDNKIVGETVHVAPLNKSAQIIKNIEELTYLRKRIKVLEEMYDETFLEQTLELALVEQQINLKGEDLND